MRSLHGRLAAICQQSVLKQVKTTTVYISTTRQSTEVISFPALLKPIFDSKVIDYTKCICQNQSGTLYIYVSMWAAWIKPAMIHYVLGL